MPTRWNIVPTEEHSFEGTFSGYGENHREFLPTVGDDLLTEVRLEAIPRDPLLTWLV